MQEKKLNDHIIVSNFHIKLNRETVLHLIDCYQNSPIYQDVIEEYEDLEAKVYPLAETAAIIKFGKLKGLIDTEEFVKDTLVIYTLMTIGNKIANLSRQYFEQGDCMAGMLVNAMADDYIFQLDGEVQKIIRKECALRHLGVLQRLEAPNNLPMENQKLILDETKASEELNMEVTEGYMFTTVKTNAYIMVLTEDEKIFNLQHNCEECKSMNCKMRKHSKLNMSVTFRDY